MNVAQMLDGEALERVVVAPATGVFELSFQLRQLQAEPIRADDVVGHVRCGADLVEITSPFTGLVREVLAWPNERVRRYQPILWLRGDDVR